MPCFFFIQINYKSKDLPLDLFEQLFHEQLEIIEKVAGIRFDLIRVESHYAKLICSIDSAIYGKTFEKELQNRVQGLVLEATYRVFSMFDPEIKTPIVLQWELIK